VREEDALRLNSLRVASEMPETEGAADQDRFLEGVEAEIVLDTDSEPPDPRALELVNKTNQFNLNGRRHSEAEWLASLRQPDAFYYLVSYRDRFGPLGKVAVLSGRREGTTLLVQTWVLSCRAFSRRIEHACLALLLEDFDVEEIAFAFEATPRNSPLQEFFTSLLGTPPAGRVRLSRECFEKNCPPLYHRVKVVAHG
jgi:FkbH-like protein